LANTCDARRAGRGKAARNVTAKSRMFALSLFPLFLPTDGDPA
jgi:hypothetical protein